jgi:hypothetical protein
VDRSDSGDRQRILGVEDHHISVAIHIAHPYGQREQKTSTT